MNDISGTPQRGDERGAGSTLAPRRTHVLTYERDERTPVVVAFAKAGGARHCGA